MSRSIFRLVLVLAALGCTGLVAAPVVSAASAAPAAKKKKKKQKAKRGPRGKTGAKGPQGDRGPAGAPGAKGDRGDQGDRGPSEGFSFAQTADASSTGVYNAATNSTFFAPAVFATPQAVPAGPQSVTARFTLSTFGSAKNVVCRLPGVDELRVTVPVGAPLLVTLLGTQTTATAATEAIVCQVAGNQIAGNLDGQTLTISAARIVAVRLGSETHP